MCITEIWTYRECGCSHQRRLPCIVAKTNTSVSRPSTLPSFRSVDFTTIHHLGYTPGATEFSDVSHNGEVTDDGLTSACQRGRTVNRTVYKQFLESICDDCVLKELGSEQSAEPGQTNSCERASTSANDLVQNGQLTLKIHEGSLLQQFQESLSTAQSSCHRGEVGIEEGDEDKNNYKNHLISYSHEIVNEPESNSCPAKRGIGMCQTGDGPDDESLPQQEQSPSSSVSSFESCIIRGRQRDRTKEQRRKGIDLSRDDLRISSRWSSGEQQSMRNFRDALKEAARDNSVSAFGRFVEKGRRSPSTKLRNVKSFMTGLRTSMSSVNLNEVLSRPRSMLGLGATERPLQVDVNGNAFLLTPRQIEFRNQHYASKQDAARTDGSNVHQPHGSAVASIKNNHHADMERPAVSSKTRENASSNAASTTGPTWQEHLKHDLEKRSVLDITVGPAAGDERGLHRRSQCQIPNLPKSDIHFTTPNASRRGSRNSADFAGIDRQPQRLPESWKYARLLAFVQSASARSRSSPGRDPPSSPALYGRRGGVMPCRGFDDENQSPGHWLWQGQGDRDVDHGRSLSGSTVAGDEDVPRCYIRLSTPSARPLLGQAASGGMELSALNDGDRASEARRFVALGEPHGCVAETHEPDSLLDHGGDDDLAESY